MYRCSKCGYISAKWLGRCPSCSSWDTLVQVDESKEKVVIKDRKPAITPMKLRDVSGIDLERIVLTSRSLNELTGGGLVRASVILLAGEPGIGKSTFLLSLAKFVDIPLRILYVSGEETLYQVADRAKRLGIEDVFFLSTNSLSAIEEILEDENYDMVIVDSIQTIYSDRLDSSRVGPAQIREVAERLVEIAKSKGIIVFIAGHVTKGGDIAGPKVLEHLVDVVFYVEGERSGSVRFIKCYKNRFGSTGNVTVFELTSAGIEVIENPSSFFLEGKCRGIPGSVVSSIVEGSRAFLVEVQALVTRALYPQAARRVSVMYDVRRLLFLLAVMEKYMGVNFRDMDIYINIPGGIMVRDNSCDLAVVTAIFSSYMDKVVPDEVVIFGEVGLGGEVRAVRDIELRLKEAMSLGKKKAYIPKVSRIDRTKFGDMEIREVENIVNIINCLF
mgnify:CR=1 FL=1